MSAARLLSIPNCSFAFNKGSQLFIRMHNEALSIVAVFVCDNFRMTSCAPRQD